IYLDSVALGLVKWLIAHASADGYLFLTRRGTPWGSRSLAHAISAARQRAGLPEGITAYSCRHAFATGAIVNEVNTATVAELLGHSGLSTIMRHYVHLSDKQKHLTSAIERAARSAIADRREG